MILRYRKPILMIAGAANIAGGLMAIVAPAFHLQSLFAVVPPEGAWFPYLWMYHYAFWITVTILGFGFLLTAKTPDDNHIILLLGGAGKLSCAMLWLYLFVTGHGGWLMISGVMYDSTFGVLFLLLFLARKKVKP